MGIVRIASTLKDITWCKEVVWDEVRKQVMKINPTLAHIIDEFNPSSKYTLIQASYPYGTNIRHKGQLYLPTEQGELATLDESVISPKICEKLTYSPSPVALIFDKDVEIYAETPQQRTVPFKLFQPGVTLGVWEIMRQAPISLRRGWNWSISAGARTLFILAKIMDTANHRKLQAAYHMRTHVPGNIFEQGKLFAEIFKHTADQNPWATQLLFFTKKWLEPHPNSIGWIKLKEYWAQEAWGQSLYWSNKMILDFNWEAYIAELAQRKFKLKPYLLDTVKHLVSIGCGVIPGFRAADDSQQVAPTQIIQDAYIKDYGLKNYAPIIMHPDFLTVGGRTNSVYYSLQAPTLPEKPYEFETFSSVMKVIRELKEYMDIFLGILKKWPKISGSDEHDFMESVKFEYFHTEVDEYSEIQHTSTMPQLDPSLGLYPKEYGERQFPENSPFFRGCIRISRIDKGR